MDEIVEPEGGPSVPIVAIGASAGGLEALERFFAQVPDDCGIAFVVIQHLSPDHKSMMAELLGRHTSMAIRVAEQGVEPLPGTISLIPSKSLLSLEDGRFVLSDKPPSPTLTMPIDIFFTALAKEHREHAVGVVLSGTGSDGSRGVRAIRNAGGVVLVQLPTTARFDGMPRSALDTGAADLVAAPEDMPARLVHLVRDGTLGDGDTTPEPSDELDQIFARLYDSMGLNFAQYKLSTIMRRIGRRMVVHQVRDLADYAAIVADSAGEREALFHDLLIGVTEFFRDPDVWEALSRDVLTPLISSAPLHGALRFWSAGCSTGEEAYSLAIATHEVVEATHRDDLDIKIFATDVDTVSVETAARGQYPESSVFDLSPARLSRYFIRRGELYEVAQSLRRLMLFAPHNLTRDPPFTKLDLITCRNVLIYFDLALQEKVLAGFHFGLRSGATLWLGSSEALGHAANSYQVVDARNRFFRTIGQRPRPTWVDDDRVLGRRTRQPEADRSEAQTDAASVVDAAINTLLTTFAPPALLVDSSLQILHVFGSAGDHLRVTPGKLSLRVTDLASPDIASMVASGVPRAIRTGEPVVFAPADLNGTGVYTVRIIPSRTTRSDAVHALIAFEAPPAGADAHTVVVDDLTARQLADLSSELELSRLEQQTLIEELEASNEELQATNEELLASNEELQATNEELQSVNEELHTVNAEYQQKIDQLEVVSSDLDHLMEVTDIGTVFLDSEMRIRKFTSSIRHYLPLLPSDVGRPLQDLRSELVSDEFIARVRGVLHGDESFEESIDSIAGPVLLRVLPYVHHEMAGAVVTFTNVTEVKRTYELARQVLDSLPSQIAFVGPDGTIRLVNRAWEQFAAENAGDPHNYGVGWNYLEVCAWGSDGQAFAVGLRGVIDGTLPTFTMEYPCHAPDDPRWFVAKVMPMRDGNAVVVHFDVTPQKRAEQTLTEVATHDYLTGLLNRRGFEERLAAHRHASARDGSPQMVLMLDIDDFKHINDTLGMASGDVVLAAVARRLEHTLRPDDVLARIGGDEFMVLLPEVRPIEATVVAERLRLAVAGKPLVVSNTTTDLTVSLAIAQITDATSTLEHILDTTRLALRTSKQDGKNRVTVASNAFEVGTGLVAQLNELVTDTDRIGVVLQPIVDLEAMTVRGYELLMRDLRPPHVSPSMLFQQAAESGLLSVFDEACLRQSMSVIDQVPAGASCHLNIYPSTLLGLVPDRFDEYFARADSVRLCIELSEQQIIGDPTYLLPAIERLRTHGVRIALDDVGFGRTALESLIVIEPDVVKIDRVYVDGVADDPTRQGWLARLARSAQSLNAVLVAEGVERVDDVDVLRAMGIQYAQGFLYGRPVPIGQALPLGPLRRPIQHRPRTDEPEPRVAAFGFVRRRSPSSPSTGSNGDTGPNGDTSSNEAADDGELVDDGQLASE
ncbi:MAG: chemotaxis protein CheB [Ilumatobacteraceae bacterium]